MLTAETPAHQVSVPAFRMDRHEVTNAQFQAFVLANRGWSKAAVGGEYLSHWDGDRIPGGQADVPVTFITWDAACAYAEWRGKRLPTEAEWEFAARSGKHDPLYPWGAEEPSPRLFNDSGSGLNRPVPVARYAPHVYGLYDLAGNV